MKLSRGLVTVDLLLDELSSVHVLGGLLSEAGLLGRVVGICRNKGNFRTLIKNPSNPCGK